MAAEGQLLEELVGFGGRQVEVERGGEGNALEELPLAYRPVVVFIELSHA